ncbi:hypothetical protein [uncultured Roseibium sp.]|uniref:hypothetical protein n=1 Tax=uncultured Roseibium sp. TaxID=1936171 RepID=UPI0025939651|nr:hypothetical protein [uncultured Roseibium sp.]
MKNIAVGIVIALLAGSTFYFYTKSQAIEQNTPRFGRLSQINKIVLAEQLISGKCTHEDDEGFGKGTIRYEWNFQAAYGFDLPIGYTWKVSEPSKGNYLISAPPLKQLYPTTVTFTDMLELNPANGNRWERMFYHARKVAAERTKKASQYALENNDALYDLAEQSAGELIRGIMPTIMPEAAIQSVTVMIPKADGSIQLITDNAC